MPFDAKVLLVLNDAKSGAEINQLFADTFRCRHEKGLSAEKSKAWSNSFKTALSDEQVAQVCHLLRS